MEILYVGTYTEKLPFVDGKGKGIYTFELNVETGSLHPLAITYNIGTNPSYLCGSTKTIYVINETEAPQARDGTQKTGYVQALEIMGNDSGLTRGALRPIGKWETHGSFPCHIALTPGGDAITVSNYGGGNVVMFPIDKKDGSLGTASDIHAFKGASMGVDYRQEASHVHSSLWLTSTSTQKQFVLVADLGMDEVHQLSRSNSESKTLTLGTNVKRPIASGPRHMAFHPGSSTVYILDELSNTIGVYRFDTTTGVLVEPSLQLISTLPGDWTTPNLAADIHLSSCSKYVYVSNRGHNSMAGYKIVDESGQLELIGWESTRGGSPRNFLVFGELMLVANQDTDTIEVFRVDSTTGKLAHTGHSVECPTPVSLFIAPKI